MWPLTQQVPTLYLFRSILDDQPGLPKGDSARDLVQTINFILRKFFKRMADDPFLMVEALTPKSRSSMKSYDHDEHDDGMAGQRDRIREKVGYQAMSGANQPDGCYRHRVHQEQEHPMESADGYRYCHGD